MLTPKREESIRRKVASPPKSHDLCRFEEKELRQMLRELLEALDAERLEKR